MKYTLTLAQRHPFADCPRFVEMEGDKIVCNDVQLPGAIDAANTYNPHNVRLFVIGHEHGAICAVFAPHAQEAFDVACDANMIDCLMSEDQDHENEELAALGNASELFDLSHTWIGEVEFDPARDIHLIVALARAIGETPTTLED